MQQDQQIKLGMHLEPSRPSFKGCRLSVQLNGLNVLTIEEADFIKAVLSFIAQQGSKETKKWRH